MDDQTRLDLKVPVELPDALTPGRHRAPAKASPRTLIIRVVALMIGALGLSAIGAAIALTGWLGHGAPLIMRSTSCGVGAVIALPLPLVLFFVVGRRVLR